MRTFIKRLKNIIFAVVVVYGLYFLGLWAAPGADFVFLSAYLCWTVGHLMVQHHAASKKASILAKHIETLTRLIHLVSEPETEGIESEILRLDQELKNTLAELKKVS